jgi:periplasmic protein TonB
MTTHLLKHSLNVLFFVAGLTAIAPAAHAQVKIAKGDAMKAAVHKTVPEYPTIARQMKATGEVDVEVSIAADGKVEDVKIISGNPLLTKAAAKAAKDWTFIPFVADGQPSRAVTVLTFEFKL